MNKNLLYGEGGQCKLCGGSRTQHENDCPGPVINSLALRVSFRWDECFKGCCGGGSSYVLVETPEEAVQRIAHYLEATEAVTVTVTGTEYEAGCPWAMKVHTSDVREAWDLVKKKKAEEERVEEEKVRASQEEEFKQSALKDLEAEREDLKPEAYDRRKTEILAGNYPRWEV